MTTWEETYYLALDSAATAFATDNDEDLLLQTITDADALLAYTHSAAIYC